MNRDVRRIFMMGVPAAAAIALFMAGPSVSADLTAKEIVQKSKEKILSLESYRFIVKGEGWETKMAEQREKVESTAKDVGKGDSKEAKEKAAGSLEPEYRKYTVEYEYMKPYLLQMKIQHSDWVPKALYGGLMTYRPDNDPKIFWFKLKFSPVAVKRDVDSEAGNFLYSTIQMQYINMEQLMQDKAPELEGTEKIRGSEAYKIAFNFKPGEKAKEHPVDLNKWGIPKEAHKSCAKEAVIYSTEDYGRIVWFIDKETLFPVALENYARDGKRMFRKDWGKIETNKLTKKDF